MNVADVIRTVNYNSHANPGRLEAVATELRRHDFLPKGGRGPWAPKVTSVEIALLVLTFVGVENISDVPDTVANISKLCDRGGSPFLPIVADIVAKPETRITPHIYGITVFPKAKVADVLGIDKKNELVWVRFMLPEQWETSLDPTAQFQSFAGRVGYIGDGLIKALSLALADDTAGEIVSE